jgi:hypothetical protein
MLLCLSFLGRVEGGWEINPEGSLSERGIETDLVYESQLGSDCELRRSLVSPAGGRGVFIAGAPPTPLCAVGGAG